MLYSAILIGTFMPLRSAYDGILKFHLIADIALSRLLPPYKLLRMFCCTDH